MLVHSRQPAMAVVRGWELVTRPSSVPRPCCMADGLHIHGTAGMMAADSQNCHFQ